MKRISIWLLFAALTPGFAAADYFYVPPRYRVHYSPYALRYQGTALVPGGLDYSMHALDYNGSGLVFEGVRYTPYALDYHSSGLIYAYSRPYVATYTAYNVTASYARRHPRRSASGERTYAAGRKPRARRATRHASAAPSTKRDAQDGIHVVHRHLRAKGFDDVDVNRILSMDGTVISADFTIRGRQVLVKYWNAEQISAMDTKREIKQKIYRRYVQDWQRFAEGQEQKGLAIYTVAESEPHSIVAALDACPALTLQPTPEEVPEDSQPRALYARQ